VSAIAAFALPAWPQPLAYHQFADQRTMFGVRNFLDVASNVAFLIAGAAGLTLVSRRRAQFQFRSERWPYALFFLGILLTALGSAYYHLRPDNERLFWDRLPITIVLMALIAGQIVDRVDVKAGLLLLLPTLLVGAATVIYWRTTERMGAGDVLPYAILQGYAVVVLLLLAARCPSRYTRDNEMYCVIGWYALAKILETFDADVFAIGRFVSGHTLKHVAAGIAGLVACHMLLRRKLRVPLVR
jgi:hypothetical protein